MKKAGWIVLAVFLIILFRPLRPSSESSRHHITYNVTLIPGNNTGFWISYMDSTGLKSFYTEKERWSATVNLSKDEIASLTVVPQSYQSPALPGDAGWFTERSVPYIKAYIRCGEEIVSSSGTDIVALIYYGMQFDKLIRELQPRILSVKPSMGSCVFFPVCL